MKKLFLIFFLFLSGCASVSPPPKTEHYVSFSLQPGPPPNVYYRIYRADCSSPPVAGICIFEGTFSRIADNIHGTTYTDFNVSAGLTYSYYATAVDAAGVESVPSNSVAAEIP